MIKLSALNGWERLWLIAAAVLVAGALVYSLQVKDYRGQSLSASCIAVTVSPPTEDYAEAKARLQQLPHATEFSPPNVLDRNGRLIMEPTPTVPTAENVAVRPSEFTNDFDYRCTTYNAVSISIFFALLASLALFAGGHLAVWIKRGFTNDVSH